MVMTAAATVEVAASPRQVLELVLDMDRYRQADTKIVRVSSVNGPDAEGRGSVRLWGRMRFTPPLPDKQDFVLERWSRITFTGAPRQPGRLVFDFTGTFDCTPNGDGGCTAIHGYLFRFRGPFKLVERFLAPWLQREVEAEVERVGEMLADVTPDNTY